MVTVLPSGMATGTVPVTRSYVTACETPTVPSTTAAASRNVLPCAIIRLSMGMSDLPFIGNQEYPHDNNPTIRPAEPDRLGRGPWFDHHHPHHPAREDVVVDHLLLGVRVPHVHERVAGVVTAMVGRQLAGFSQIGAAGVEGAERQKLPVGDRRRDRYAMVCRVLVRLLGVRRRVAVYVVAQPGSRPLEHRVRGLSRRGGNGEDLLREVRARYTGDALEKHAVPRQ